jgi:hypothetical protein
MEGAELPSLAIVPLKFLCHWTAPIIGEVRPIACALAPAETVAAMTPH